MRRRAVVALLLLALAVSFGSVVGCSNPEPSESVSTPEQESPAATPETEGETEAEEEAGTMGGAATDGPAVIAQKCASCHPASTADKPQGDTAKAEALVNDMISKGAQLTEPEKQAVIEYLSR